MLRHQQDSDASRKPSPSGPLAVISVTGKIQIRRSRGNLISSESLQRHIFSELLPDGCDISEALFWRPARQAYTENKKHDHWLQNAAAKRAHVCTLCPLTPWARTSRLLIVPALLHSRRQRAWGRGSLRGWQTDRHLLKTQYPESAAAASWGLGIWDLKLRAVTV